MAKRLTLYILAGLVLGLIVGLVLNGTLDDGSAPAQARLTEIAGYFSILTTIFLRLIKMIIAPLVFATLVSGIAQMGDTTALGRIGVPASPCLAALSTRLSKMRRKAYLSHSTSCAGVSKLRSR